MGGVALKVYETPGHSNCSISAYEPDAGILFGSDAIGIPFSDKFFPSMNTNIDQFLNSLEKLKPLKVNLFCADHYGYITGDEAQTIVSETIEEALRWKARLYEVFRRNAFDIDAAAREITSSFYQEMSGYFLAPEILEGVFKQIFKYIAKSSQPPDLDGHCPSARPEPEYLKTEFGQQRIDLVLGVDSVFHRGVAGP